MAEILILGAGNIGSRHLQGLRTLSIPSRVYVVDPSADSLDTAKRRWEESEGATHRVTYHESVTDLPVERVDLAILATPSSVRKDAFDTLVERLQVEYLVFEKVLFQRPSEYEEVEDELNERGIDAWVNCPRRAFDVYRRIHERVDARPVDVDVVGNDWGLGSNAVHFADLFCLLAGTTDLQWETDALEGRTVPSKRGGFEEFLGRLTGADAAGNSIALRCFEDGATGLSVRIATPEHRWVVNETTGTAMHETVDPNGEWTAETASVDIPYQSELTGDLAEQILETGRSDLVGFRESKAYHVPLLEALIAHIEDVRGETVEACPIT